MFHSLPQDLRYALRSLRTSPGFSTIAILSLALGIGANTAIFSLIDSVILKSLPVSNPEQLLRVASSKQGGYFTNPMWEQLRDRQDILSAFAFGTARFNLTAGGESRYADGYWASGDFFSTLGVRTVLGRSFTAADDRRGCSGIAVLTYDFWQREYSGSPDAIEKTISLDQHPFQIVGVTQPGFSGVNVGRPLDVMVPLCSEAIIHGTQSSLDRRSNWWLNVLGRPRLGISAQQVTARLQTLSPEIMKATLPPNWRAEDQQTYLKRTLGAESAANGLSYLRREYQPALMALMVVVALVLLIACANVANLLLARATVRQREIAIRLAIGAGRSRIVRQLLTESLVLSIAGAALGALFAQWSTRLLVSFFSATNSQVSLDLAPDGRVLGFTIAVAVATGILFGMAPAWKATRVQPQAAIKANARGVVEGHSRFGLGKVLVIVQVALSLVLVAGAGLLLASFRNLATLNPGFDRDRVLLMDVDLRQGNYPEEQRQAAYRQMKERLGAIAGVQTLSYSTLTPISGSSANGEVRADGFTPKSREDAVVYFNEVGSGYFETLRTPVLSGRDFNQWDTPKSPKVAVINETMARKLFGNSNPLGKYFSSDIPSRPEPPYQVVGVVKDAKYVSLREEILPTAYTSATQDGKPGVYATFEMRTAGSVADVIPAARKTMAEINRGIALDFTSLATQVSESLNRERLLATLSGFFGALALLLATMGLYGVMSYNVARRRSEIGIRMALGAEQQEVLRMVLWEVVLLVAVGLAVGAGVTLATTRLVGTFLFGLKPTDPATLLLAGLTLATVAAIAGYLPARRASRLDPMTALREE